MWIASSPTRPVGSADSDYVRYGLLSLAMATSRRSCCCEPFVTARRVNHTRRPLLTLEFQYNSCVKAPRSFAASPKALRIVRERLGYKASTAVKAAMELRAALHDAWMPTSRIWRGNIHTFNQPRATPPATCYPGWLRIFRETYSAQPQSASRRRAENCLDPGNRPNGPPLRHCSQPLIIAYGLRPTAVAAQMRPANF